ncbi:MAG: glycosyltransferase, partial [Thermoanaerobaculia bacterium]
MIWVKAGKLLPVDTGGKIRSYNILRHLAARHDVTVFSYYPGERDAAYEQELHHLFPGAEAVALGAPGGLVRRAMHYAVRFPNLAPYSITKYTAPRVSARLAQLIRDRAPQVAICDFLTPSLNFAPQLSASSVLFQHNVESALWRRQAQYEQNVAKRALFWIEAAKMDRYERATIKRFQSVIAVSEHDRALMLAMVPDAEVTVVPTGVDLDHFRRPSMGTPSHPVVLFLGSMDWPANIDGVEFFCAEVWPRVVAAVP